MAGTAVVGAAALVAGRATERAGPGAGRPVDPQAASTAASESAVMAAAGRDNIELPFLLSHIW